jgi:hypothetical protein
MNEELKEEFIALTAQITKGFASNERQFRALKTRMAKLELDMQALKRVENRRSEEIIELKTKRA